MELTEACLQRIEKYNPAFNAFITVTRQEALRAAREAEAEIQRGRWRGPLHGVPIALKDNIDTAGIRTTGASLLGGDRGAVDLVGTMGLYQISSMMVSLDQTPLAPGARSYFH